MEIDPHNLPKEAGILRQIVLQLLGVVEEKDRLLERVQHQLQQLLRQRYGPKRERIDENQLFLFAAQIIAAARQAKAAEPGAQGSGASGTTRRAHGKGHGRKPLPASLERRRVGSTWRKRNGNAGTARNRCNASERTLANDWSSSPPLSM
jgi:hypothetical protein